MYSQALGGLLQVLVLKNNHRYGNHKCISTSLINQSMVYGCVYLC